MKLYSLFSVHFGIYAYTAIWNTLSFPAGVVPFGKESGKNVEESVESEDPYLQIASKVFSSHAKKGLFPTRFVYTQHFSRGAI